MAPAEAGLDDHVGGFAVGIHGADELAGTFEAAGDDYSAIMAKALADRLAEASSPSGLHQQSRRAWHAPEEKLSSDDLVAERFRGIRPAFKYPACPDHSEKPTLFALLEADRAGLALTARLYVDSGASVSGLYSGTPPPATSPSDASAATRSRTTRGAGARSCRSSSAGSALTLAYDPR